MSSPQYYLDQYYSGQPLKMRVFSLCCLYFEVILVNAHAQITFQD
jgi:hypothetical protein